MPSSTPYPRPRKLRPLSRPAPKLTPLEGLPDLPATALKALSPDGTRLILAEGCAVHLVALDLATGRARPEACHHLSDPITHLTMAPDGTSHAWTERRCPEGPVRGAVCRIETSGVTEIAALPGPARAPVATRMHLAFVDPGADLAQPALVLLNARTGRLLHRTPLRSPRTRLRAGAADAILINDPGQPGSLRWMDTAHEQRRCPPRPPRVPPRRPEPEPGPRHEGCDCCCAPEPIPPETPDPRPPRGGPNRGETCVPGDDGVVDDCRVYTIENGRILSRNICDDRPDPCIGHVALRPERLVRTARLLAVRDESGLDVAVLDAARLTPLTTYRGAGSPLTILAAPAADQFLFFDEGGGATLFDASPLLPQLDLDLSLGTQTLTFEGQESATAWERGGIQKGLRRVLVVPVMEGHQDFPETGSLATYFSASNDVGASLEIARDYYREVSYEAVEDGAGLDVEFHVFGRDTGSVYTGPPVRIDGLFSAYWNDGWQPGGVSATAPHPSGGAMVFSGDQRLELTTNPIIVDPRTFLVRPPAASFRVRIPEAPGGYVLDFGPAGATPARTLSLSGEDRSGAGFSLSGTSASWPGGTAPITVTLVDRAAIPDALDDLAEAFAILLDTAGPHPFAPPEVTWQDDAEDWGMLHVALRFADPDDGGDPFVDSFDFDAVLPEFAPGSDASLPGVLMLPGAEDLIAEYLMRACADATVAAFESPRIQDSQIDYSDRPITVISEAGMVTTSIFLAAPFGQTSDEDDPTRIAVTDQTGLDALGFDSATPIDGGTVALSGSGGPTVARPTDLFSDIYTAMIDRILATSGDGEAETIDRINALFNCAGPLAGDCTLYHSVVVVPVFANPTSPNDGATLEPRLDNIRAFCKGSSMKDRGPGGSGEARAQEVLPIGANRAKMWTRLRFGSKAPGDAAVLTHEIGHCLLSLRDQYSSGTLREGLRGMGSYDLMAGSSSDTHLSSYHKRVSGWLNDPAILRLDRPRGTVPLFSQFVLVQLEGWDPGRDLADWISLARDTFPDLPVSATVYAAAFLRLGANSHQFDIIELRGQGAGFSQGITPARLVVYNAVDHRDTTRYGIDTTDADILESSVLRYRRQIHLLDDSLTAPGDSVDLGTLSELAEAGLQITLVDIATTSLNGAPVTLARVQVDWERGDAIDLGFRRSLPDWQSPDLAVLRPGMGAEDEFPSFPDSQDPEDLEHFVIPEDNEGPLRHVILARLHNEGSASAFNVQVDLVRRLPAGGGDWKDGDIIGSHTMGNGIELPPGGSLIIPFEWNVDKDMEKHFCFRAQVGDRDPEPGASDDTNDDNDWAQQNVFVYEAEANSPPAPVEFSYTVENDGPYPEVASLAPRGLGAGATVQITPDKLRIPPNGRGTFRVRVELSERLLHARCGKDITFLLEAFREYDHSDDPWGAAHYTIKPRFATETRLEGHVMGDKLVLHGSVSPDVGAYPVLLHIDLPGEDPIWTELTLGPGSSFDLTLPAEIPSGSITRATARFEGTQDHASSVSETLVLDWIAPG